MEKKKHRFEIGDYIGYRLKGDDGTLTYYGTVKEKVWIGSAQAPAYKITGFGDIVEENPSMFKSKSKSKTVKDTYKKNRSNSWTAKLKKLAGAELLALANNYEVKYRKVLRNIRFNADGSAKWIGQAHDYTVWQDQLGLKGTIKIKNNTMATAKKPSTKKKRSVTAKKLCSKVIKREGIKADGTLMKGWKWAKGGGRAIKAKGKTGLRKPQANTCVKTNRDGSTTTYTGDNNGGCRYGGVRQRVSSLNAPKKKQPKKKPIRKHPGINQRTGKLKPGWRYLNGRPVQSKAKK